MQKFGARKLTSEEMEFLIAERKREFREQSKMCMQCFLLPMGITAAVFAVLCLFGMFRPIEAAAALFTFLLIILLLFPYGPMYMYFNLRRFIRKAPTAACVDAVCVDVLSAPMDFCEEEPVNYALMKTGGSDMILRILDFNGGLFESGKPLLLYSFDGFATRRSIGVCRQIETTT